MLGSYPEVTPLLGCHLTPGYGETNFPRSEAAEKKYIFLFKMWWFMGDVEANWYHATAEAAVPGSTPARVTIILLRVRAIVQYCTRLAL